MSKRIAIVASVLALAAVMAIQASAARRVTADVGLPAAHAWEKPVGVLTSTGTSVNNTTTAVTFTTGCSVTYAIQCDAAACVRVGSGASTAASCTMGNANAGVQLAALQLYDAVLTCGAEPSDTIAMISVTGTANCQVWKVVL